MSGFRYTNKGGITAAFIVQDLLLTIIDYAACAILFAQQIGKFAAKNLYSLTTKQSRLSPFCLLNRSINVSTRTINIVRINNFAIYFEVNLIAHLGVLA